MPSRIPQAFIDDLMTRTDIVELIDGYVPLKKKGKEYSACCPFHNEKTASFTVSPDKQFYHCFGCGAHGTAIGFLMEYERLDFIEAIEVLAQQHGLEIPRDEFSKEVNGSRQDLLNMLEQANTYYKKQLREHQPAINYLKNRGVSGDVAAKFDLGYAPDNFDNLITQFHGAATQDQLLQSGLIKNNEKGNFYDRFRNRIVFPIKDRRGRVIGFGGRVLDDSIPKYLNSPETPLFHKSESLYGLYEARKAKSTSQYLIVVEGYMDVVALSQHGVENVVATLGTATTPQHIQQLYRCTQEIIFCFDGDRAGRDAAWRAAQHTIPLFSDGVDAKFLFLPQGEDPDSLIRNRGKEIFLQYIKDGESLSSFIFDKLSENTDIRTPAGKARLAQLAKPLLEKFPNGVFKNLIFEELEKIVGTKIQHSSTNINKSSDNKPSNKGTPVRLAIAALLREPALVSNIEFDPSLDITSISGVPLLTKVADIWKVEPDLNHAALIERFRGTNEETQLQKLLTWSTPELENPEQALEDALHWVHRKLKETRIQQLIDKESTDGLNEDERLEFRNLLEQKAS